MTNPMRRYIEIVEKRIAESGRDGARLSEAWVATVPSSGAREHVDVYVNPSRQEWAKAMRASEGVLRGWLGTSDLVIFDADEVHHKVWLGLRAQGLDSVIPKGGIAGDSGEQRPINLHMDAQGPFLESDNWMAIFHEDGQPEFFDAAAALVASHPMMKRLYANPVLTIRDSY